MKRIIWTVVFRGPDDPKQQELVRYTEEAANQFANLVQENGGVAVIIEGDEEAEDDGSFNQRNNGELQWL
jgi:hypothetical protein